MGISLDANESLKCKSLWAVRGILNVFNFQVCNGSIKDNIRLELDSTMSQSTIQNRILILKIIWSWSG